MVERNSQNISSYRWKSVTLLACLHMSACLISTEDNIQFKHNFVYSWLGNRWFRLILIPFHFAGASAAFLWHYCALFSKFKRMSFTFNRNCSLLTQVWNLPPTPDGLSLINWKNKFLIFNKPQLCDINKILDKIELNKNRNVIFFLFSVFGQGMTLVKSHI